MNYKAATEALRALIQEHQRTQEQFCKEFTAGKANPLGLPSNDTYIRLPDVRAVGNKSFSYPMWVLADTDIVSQYIIDYGSWEEEETVHILQKMKEWEPLGAEDWQVCGARC